MFGFRLFQFRATTLVYDLTEPTPYEKPKTRNLHIMDYCLFLDMFASILVGLILIGRV